MSTEQNKAVLRRWMEGWNTRDVNVMDKLADELFTSDCTPYGPGIDELPRGPKGAKHYVRESLKNIPEIQITTEDMIAEGDKVALRVMIRGTEASTGKPISIGGIAIYRFTSGRMAAAWQS